MNNTLRVIRAAELPERPASEPAWLVEPLWGLGAVGLIGGAPKCGKTWLALELAVAIASGRPALGHYPVHAPGTVLVYGAEDSPRQLRDRLAGLAQVRGADFASLAVHLIIEPSLRLDRQEDLRRLECTLQKYRPRLLVLDPYVRLQRVDENDATQVATILAALRQLSRLFRLAILLVHHTRKNPSHDAGQALRGSSDFFAWADTLLHLGRRRGQLCLSVEHRAAATPPPVTLELYSDPPPVHLQVQNQLPTDSRQYPSQSLEEQLLAVLRDTPSQRQDQLRAMLRVRNQRLVEVLHDLERAGRITRTTNGWRLADSYSRVPDAAS
jgi:hypothetical protein